MSRSLLPALFAPAALSAGALWRLASTGREGGFLARLHGRGASSGQSWREQAQERLLNDMADRIARLEIALLREQRHTEAQMLRAGRAEAAIIRLQSMLDTLRQERAGRDGAATLPCPADVHAP